MKACTKTNCFMIRQCTHFDAYIRATMTDKIIPVEFADMYKPDDYGKCLNFEFKSDAETVDNGEE